MTAREFVYWLQGYFEIAGDAALTPTQVGIIQRHLALVFKHEIDPSYPNQAALNEIHGQPGKFSEEPLNDVIVRC
jgi:hypothetical protein